MGDEPVSLGGCQLMLTPHSPNEVSKASILPGFCSITLTYTVLEVATPQVPVACTLNCCWVPELVFLSVALYSL